MDKDSKFTRDEEGYVAVRTVSAPYSSGTDDKDSMFTRDEDGYVAVRTISGSGGGGGGGDQHNLGYYATLEALEEAHPTAEAGDWAIVGTTDTVWIWDTDNSEWVDSDRKGQVTSVNNQTGAVTITEADILPDQTGQSGKILTTDGFVAGWVLPEIVQRSTMPMATEDESGKIYQYVGATDANYTNGYFYKCESDGGNPATYFWVRLDVQPTVDPLPSQTGNDGKYLRTNGTTASWESTTLSPATAPTLVAANWSSNTQTITVNGVTANNTVFVGPIPTDAEDYADAGILCTGQALNSLTFTCVNVPATDLQVNIVIM